MIIQSISALSTTDAITDQGEPLEADTRPLELQLEQALRNCEPGSQSFTDRGESPDGSVVSKSVGAHVSEPNNSKRASSRPPSLCVTTSVSMSTCSTSCPCRCHTKTQLRSPRWAKTILGSLTFQSRHVPIFNNRTCNHLPCSGNQPTTMRFTYHAPPWAFSKLFQIAVANQDLFGLNASVTVRIPTVIPYSSPVFDYITRGDIDGLRRSEISPYTIGTDGESLLHVGTVLE